MSQNNRDRTNWIGICLLVIGIAYLNRNYHWNIFHLHEWIPFNIFSWPSMLITIGLLLVIFGRSSGVFLMLFGLFFLFTEEVFMAIRHVHEWWPLALIIVGIFLLARSGSVQKSQ